MAISYSLELATSSSAAQVAHALRDVGLSAGLFDASTAFRLDKQGEIADQQDDMWPPRRLALLSQRYRRATHTFSEE